MALMVVGRRKDGIPLMASDQMTILQLLRERRRYRNSGSAHGPDLTGVEPAVTTMRHLDAGAVAGLDLRDADLSGLDLRDADLSFADLSGTDLTGTRLQGATLHQTRFCQVRVATLLAAGLSAKQVLQQRSAYRSAGVPALHFSPGAQPATPGEPRDEAAVRLLVTERECAAICRALGGTSWEQLDDVAVFAVLVPDQPWDPAWMPRCRTRGILDWALAHRAYLSRTATNVPYYGRVLPVTLIDEVESADLVAGTKTNPERVLHALGMRQILHASDLKGADVSYPRSPLGNGADVVQITSRRGLQIEGGLMRHCVASYDSACLDGDTFIYHVGAPAPEGSTLQIAPGGDILQHRAAANRRPDPADLERVRVWLAHHGITIDTGTHALMATICARLRARRIQKVSFDIYWYHDEDHVDSVEALDAEGHAVPLYVVTDDELWNLVREEHGRVHGAWMLYVDDARLDYCGEAEVPDDDEDWDEDENDEVDDEREGDA